MTRYTEPIAHQFDEWMSRVERRVTRLERRRPTSAGARPGGGWTDLPLVAGFTGAKFSVQRAGDVVYIRGTVTPSTGWSSTSVVIVPEGGIPVGLRPVDTNVFFVGTSVTTMQLRCTVRTDGSITASLFAGSSAVSPGYFFGHLWLAV